MYFQFAKMVAVLTMVAGGAGILANCLNIFILSRYRVTFVMNFKCVLNFVIVIVFVLCSELNKT